MTTILAKIEDEFMKAYYNAANDMERIKYLRYFNHAAAMRNRLEFNGVHNTD
jgi:hypothetical protein